MKSKNMRNTKTFSKNDEKGPEAQKHDVPSLEKQRVSYKWIVTCFLVPSFLFFVFLQIRNFS